jgi:hypothetical protein
MAEESEAFLAFIRIGFDMDGKATEPLPLN